MKTAKKPKPIESMFTLGVNDRTMKCTRAMDELGNLVHMLGNFSARDKFELELAAANLRRVADYAERRANEIGGKVNG